ncbi:MAG: hypothetical protein ABI443_09680, partial [Chthoniobacterales bacterium]
MKSRFTLFRRGNGVYYIEDRQNKSQTSLHTKDQEQAERLLAASKEAQEKALNNMQMARVYATASEPEIATRTWADVFDEIIKQKKTDSTLKRWRTAKKDIFI